jgi:uncharacterized protein (TIGR00297 family)
MRLDIETQFTTSPPHRRSSREHVQSAALTWSVCTVLGLFAVTRLLTALHDAGSRRAFAASLLISVGFGVVVWLLRAATKGGVVAGTLICLTLLLPPAEKQPHIHYGGLTALISLFVISFLATRFGRSRKEAHRLAEPRRGRQASQIVANLGAAALFACAGSSVGCIAALAQAAADTASSEIGQAVGGPVRLLTSWKPVPSGTDGGITLAGTGAGILAAAIIVIAGRALSPMWGHTLIAFFAAVAGLFFDSFLGATVERKGWLYNDLVNFTSTIFAAGLATALS